MSKFFYDLTDGEIITSFGNMAFNSKGDMFMRLGEGSVMNTTTGDMLMRIGKDSFMNTSTGDVIMRTGLNTVTNLNTGKMHFFFGNLWDSDDD